MPRRPRLARSRVRVSDTVTPHVLTPASYSGYACWTASHLQPGQSAVVKSIDVPSVRREGVSFCTARYIDQQTGEERQVALTYDNIVVITPVGAHATDGAMNLQSTLPSMG